MRIKKGFVLEKVGDSYLCCATGKLAKEFSGFVRLNETGAFIWNMLASGDTTKEKMVEQMTSEYDISAEIALKDIEGFIANLDKNGILE
ncbi:MAG: PqqD family protein [Ruminococcaceae bacterium]|nr:PqqD family protein [Oscillospiraceae bacterium]